MSEYREGSVFKHCDRDRIQASGFVGRDAGEKAGNVVKFAE